MNGAELLVSALENEGVEQIFGLPGEENLVMVEALRRSSIKLVVTRHEQAAAFMAATHGLYAESFLRELKRLGHRVVVLTRADALGYDWPRDMVDQLYAVPDIFDEPAVENAVSYLAREERIDRLIGPGEYDIELAARLREHLRVPGMGETTARYFRDKLAMRERALGRGIKVPAFIGAIHRPSIARFLAETPGPWVLKPRMAASSKGIQKLGEAEQVWRALDALGDKAANHLIERFTPGDVSALRTCTGIRTRMRAPAPSRRKSTCTGSSFTASS